MNKYLTVTALTNYIKRKLDTDPHLRNVYVKGEISNFNHHYRGHMYFTLKDDESVIKAAMFLPDNRHLKFKPEDGMHVLVRGYVSLYNPQGQHQIIVKEMQPDGVGSLFLAFDQLKEKLSKAGYFDEKYKQPVPKYPKHIGIITSPTGAAVRDIITTIKRRYPIADVTVIPVSVQGDDAALSIKHGIEYANELNKFDVLILARGGGSIEDLWSFNEEIVAKAIFQSKIPIISGVGHETDVTISDFVADLRAPTPTGAAELAVPDLSELKMTISHLQARLTKLTKINFMQKQEKLQNIKNSYVFHYPKQLIQEKEQYIDRLMDKMDARINTIFEQKRRLHEHLAKRLTIQHPQTKIDQAKIQLQKQHKDLNKQIQAILDKKESELIMKIDKLTLLNPLQIMKRGFSITFTDDGEIVKNIEKVSENDKVHIRLLDGTLECVVEEIRRDNSGGE